MIFIRFFVYTEYRMIKIYLDNTLAFEAVIYLSLSLDKLHQVRKQFCFQLEEVSCSIPDLIYVIEI